MAINKNVNRKEKKGKRECLDYEKGQFEKGQRRKYKDRTRKKNMKKRCWNFSLQIKSRVFRRYTFPGTQVETRTIAI